MRKRMIGMIFVGMLCMLVGCQSEGTGKSAKYKHVVTGNLTEEIQEDLELLGSDYVLTSIHGFDETSIEAYLQDYMYRSWYKEGENTPVEMTESSFGDMEYGVCYIVRAGVDGYEAMETDIIKLYEIGKEKEALYMRISSSYELGADGSPLVYNCMSVGDATGENREYYLSIPQSDLDALYAGTYDFGYYDEEYYSEEYDYGDFYEDYVEEPEPTKTPEPDKSDIYFAAMDYIDEVISESHHTKDYAGYKYKILKKGIYDANIEALGLKTRYEVRFAIQFEGVSQKYTVCITINASHSSLYNKWYYDYSSSNVKKGNTVY